MTWDEGTPLRQTGQTAGPVTVTTETTHPGQGMNKQWTTEDAVEDAQATTFGKRVAETGIETTTVIENGSDQKEETHLSATQIDKSDQTSEDSQGTVTKSGTDGTIENNLTVSAQEKTTTDNLTTETVEDEDSVLTTLNTGTQTTELAKDTTQATATTAAERPARDR